MVESENGKLRAESMEVKQKASEEYQSKIAEILGKAFNLSTQGYHSPISTSISLTLSYSSFFPPISLKINNSENYH